MSLDFNLTKITPSPFVSMPPTDLTRDLIFSTMVVHLGTISARNLREWQFRLAILKRLNIIDVACSIVALKAHIGLSVNVSDKSRAAFLNLAMKSVVRDTEWELRPVAATQPETSNV